MDKEEARGILASELAALRTLGFGDLVGRLLERQEVLTRTGPATGATYQLELQAFWDDRRGGPLRVMASIDDGAWRAIVPLTEDFIIAPDGSFVDE